MERMRIEPKFKKGDYIINHASGDIGIVKGVTKKGYYTFKAYLGGMFGWLDLGDHELQINYQKFYDLCTDDEKKVIDKAIKENEQPNQ
jgi:hypothetical protein